MNRTDAWRVFPVIPLCSAMEDTKQQNIFYKYYRLSHTCRTCLSGVKSAKSLGFFSQQDAALDAEASDICE